MTTTTNTRAHWTARIAAIAGIPYGIVMLLLGSFIIFSLAFVGHPAFVPSAIHFGVSSLLFLADIGFSIALLVRSTKRATFFLLLINGAQTVALPFVIVGSLALSPMESGQFIHWVCFALAPVRFVLFFVGWRKAVSESRQGVT